MSFAPNLQHYPKRGSYGFRPWFNRDVAFPAHGHQIGQIISRVNRPRYNVVNIEPLAYPLEVGLSYAASHALVAVTTTRLFRLFFPVKAPAVMLGTTALPTRMAIGPYVVSLPCRVAFLRTKHRIVRLVVLKIISAAAAFRGNSSAIIPANLGTVTPIKTADGYEKIGIAVNAFEWKTLAVWLSKAAPRVAAWTGAKTAARLVCRKLLPAMPARRNHASNISQLAAMLKERA